MAVNFGYDEFFKRPLMVPDDNTQEAVIGLKISGVKTELENENKHRSNAAGYFAS